MNTINVSKASNWSHAVSFNRPIGTSVKAEFLRVRRVVIDNIHNNNWPFIKLSKYHACTPRLNQLLFLEPQFFDTMLNLQRGQYEATLSKFT